MRVRTGNQGRYRERLPVTGRFVMTVGLAARYIQFRTTLYISIRLSGLKPQP